VKNTTTAMLLEAKDYEQLDFINIIMKVLFHHRYCSCAGSGQAVDQQNLPSWHEVISVTYQRTTDTFTET